MPTSTPMSRSQLDRLHKECIVIQQLLETTDDPGLHDTLLARLEVQRDCLQNECVMIQELMETTDDPDTRANLAAQHDALHNQCLLLLDAAERGAGLHRRLRLRLIQDKSNNNGAQSNITKNWYEDVRHPHDKRVTLKQNKTPM